MSFPTIEAMHSFPKLSLSICKKSTLKECFWTNKRLWDVLVEIQRQRKNSFGSQGALSLRGVTSLWKNFIRLLTARWVSKRCTGGEMKSEGSFYSESSRISTGKLTKRISENQGRHLKWGVNMSFPVFCGQKESQSYGHATDNTDCTCIKRFKSRECCFEGKRKPQERLACVL